MNKTSIKTILFLLIMAACMATALLSKNFIYCKLFAGIAIMVGALASHSLSHNKHISHE